MRVKLSYRTPIDVEAYDAGVVLRLIRLLAEVSFAGPTGWTPSRAAIVDTGAPVSVIPSGIWQAAQYRLLVGQDFSVSIGGSPATGRLAELAMRVHDGTAVSPLVRIKAYLLSDDTHPLILGFEDVLTEASLFSDFTVRTAYLDFPEAELA